VCLVLYKFHYVACIEVNNKGDLSSKRNCSLYYNIRTPTAHLIGISSLKLLNLKFDCLVLVVQINEL